MWEEIAFNEQKCMKIISKKVQIECLSLWVVSTLEGTLFGDNLKEWDERNILTKLRRKMSFFWKDILFEIKLIFQGNMWNTW